MSKTLVALAAILSAVGCNPFAKRLKEDNANEQDHNRTLAKAAMVMNGVKAWSAAHGDTLPNPTQFRQEVHPVLPPSNGFGITESELQGAFKAFEWSFPGGRPRGGDVGEQEVGRLADSHGGAIGYADGTVRRGYERSKGG